MPSVSEAEGLSKLKHFYEYEDVTKASKLRNNMTRQEKHLWYDYLRDNKVKVYRQRVIGKYIVDFYCSAAKLVIEVDGGQHFDEEIRSYDQLRTEILKSKGLKVIRIPNNEIDKNFHNVCEYIEREINLRVKNAQLTPQSPTAPAPLCP
ncbi:MAG: endonuclease domain-containing protein [Phascolarctobacterium sp.]|nr:endonuclease domain-containing protein [Phascolarctobacterium sp.]